MIIGSRNSIYGIVKSGKLDVRIRRASVVVLLVSVVNFRDRHDSGAVDDFLGKFLKPRLDVYESPKTGEIVATFELPGLEKQDVQIRVHDDQLVVSGRQRVTKEHKGALGFMPHDFDRGTVKFSRAVRLPRGTQVEDIHASMTLGILTVTYPRAPRMIPSAQHEVFIE